MKSLQTIDNSIEEEMKRVILWQYDNADRFVRVIGLLKELYDKTTKDFWDGFPGKINIEGTDTFSLTIYGIIFGVGRPVVTIGGVKVEISDDLYRRILKARQELLSSNASLLAYKKFIDYVFSGNVRAVDGEDMSLSFLWVSTIPTLGECDVTVNVTVNGENSVLIRSGSKFTYDSVVFSTSSDITIEGGTSELVCFKASSFKQIPIGTTVIIKTSGGASISGLSDTETTRSVFPTQPGYANHEMYSLLTEKINNIIKYPAGVKSHDQNDGPVFGFDEQVRVVSGTTTQKVSTSVILTIKNTSAASITISSTAKCTYNSHDFVVSFLPSEETSVTIASGETVNLRFVYSDEDYIPARSITSIKNGASIITGLSVSNQYRSMTDFKIGNFSGCVLSWNRFIDR